MQKWTYDCAFLEPLLAFPPDLPPDILNELMGGLKLGELFGEV